MRQKTQNPGTNAAADSNGSARRKIWADNKPLRLTIAFSLLVIGVAESLLSGWQMKRKIEDEAAARFEGVCDEAATKIRERLTAYAVMMQGAQALFSASENVTRQEWHEYIRTLNAWETVPGFLGIGFVLPIKPADLDAHVRQIRSEGFADYSVRPPGLRDLYTAIVYIEPFSGRNLRAFGYDMFSEPVRRKAMENSRDTGKAALSGKVTLVQEDGTDTQAGSLMYAPVYRKGAPIGTPEEKRKALIGWVYSAYRMRDLLTRIIPDSSVLGRAIFQLRVYDGSNPSAGRLLFEDVPASRSRDPESMLSSRRIIDFNGHQWLLDFGGTWAAGEIRYGPAWFAAIGGMLITGLLFSMMLLAFKRHDAQRRAEELADQIRGMAFHDSLTKLPNRLLLRDRLEMALAASKRSGCLGALMMVDLDNFKPLNDEHGHAAGDLLLIEVAKRIRGCVRETDTVARIGGDEFIVLLASLNGGEEAARREAGAAADKILEAISRPYHFETEKPGEERIDHRCSSSIGITLFSGAEASQSAIIKRADNAMYTAKRAGRNRAQFDTAGHDTVRESENIPRHT